MKPSKELSNTNTPQTNTTRTLPADDGKGSSEKQQSHLGLFVLLFVSTAPLLYFVFCMHRNRV